MAQEAELRNGFLLGAMGDNMGKPVLVQLLGLVCYTETFDLYS